MFIPFGRTMDLVYSAIGALLFSGYVVYDTYMISNRLSPDEYIVAAISLYLEYVFCFCFLLRAGDFDSNCSCLSASSTSVSLLVMTVFRAVLLIYFIRFSY